MLTSKNVRYWLNVHSHIVDDAESETEMCMGETDVIRFCDEIAQAAEEETKDLRELETVVYDEITPLVSDGSTTRVEDVKCFCQLYNHLDELLDRLCELTGADDWDEALRGIADLQAQVAVMAEALKMHMQWIGPPPTGPDFYDSLREDAWALGQQALSAAPKVVWAGEAVMGWDGTMPELLLSGDIHTIPLVAGDVHNVIVLAREQGQPMPDYPEGHQDWRAPNVFTRLPKGEQGQDSEQGE